MTTDAFYDSTVFETEVDFTMISDAELQPPLRHDRAPFSSRLINVAAVAFAGVLTLSIATWSTSTTDPRTTSSVASPPTRSPKPAPAMTATMKRRAALAERLFAHVPHPGADEPDPDYGL
jgi:hypothetical protein